MIRARPRRRLRLPWWQVEGIVALGLLTGVFMAIAIVLGLATWLP